jgi:hypothetical protein
MSDPNLTAPPDNSPPADAPPTAPDTTSTSPTPDAPPVIPPPANAPAPPVPSKDTAMHNAFMLGWGIVELKSRILKANDEIIDSGLRLASVWRAIFSRLASLQNQVFPRCSTAQTLYQPPSKESLPYLYPPEPDYANLGIRAGNAQGTAILSDFGLYDVTRRAINCLSLLYVKEDEGLIPDLIGKYQNHLVKAILDAAENPGGGGGEVPPDEGASQPEDDLTKARETLTALTKRFLDAWDGYLRENYFVGGDIPDDDLELVAYEAGHSMSSISWGITVTTVPLERQAEAATSQPNTATAGGQASDTSKKFAEAWQGVFQQQAVIRLQHQISALSSALDDAYYSQHKEVKRPEEKAVLVAPNPDLPSQAILAVKHSIDYWQRAVAWISKPENLEGLRDKEAQGSGSWSKQMRLALTEQANIWQTLMTGQQSLRAFNMESATNKIMQDVTGEIQKSLRKDFKGSVKQAEQVMKEMAQEVQQVITDVGQTAKAGLANLLGTYKRWLWIILGGIAVLFVLGIIWFLLGGSDAKLNAMTASGGTGITGLITALLGVLGLRSIKGKKEEHEAAIDKGQDNAKTMVETKAAAAGTAGASNSGGSLLTRIGDAAQETGSMVLKALERGYEQIRIELSGLGRSVAVAYPLVEFFVLTFKLESDKDFLTEIIWNGAERAEEIRQVARAAFGPLALFIIPSTSDTEDEN